MTVIVATSLASANVASASPLIAGPSVDANGVGYTSPSLAASVGSNLTKNGVALATAVPTDASGGVNGPQSVLWSEAGASSLPRIGPATGAGSAASTFAQAINERGTIVGYAMIRTVNGATTPRAVRWSTTTSTPVLLDALGVSAFNEKQAAALAVNATGLTVGSAHLYNASGTDLGTRAVYWLPGSLTPVALDAFNFDRNGNTNANVNAVNNSGTMVGAADTFSFGTYTGSRAARWDTQSAIVTQLDDLGTSGNGSGYASAVAINSAGTAIGTSDKYDANSHRLGTRPVRWDAGQTTATELDLPGDPTNRYAEGYAVAINNAGTIAGLAEVFDADGYFNGHSAVRWAAGGHAVTVLGNLGSGSGGYVNSIASAVNAGGAIVGQCDRFDEEGSTRDTRAVLWTGTNTLAIDLNDRLPANSGWALEAAQAISDTGFISGIGLFDPDGAGGRAAYERGFTLMIPEAGTYGLGDATLDGKIDFADLLLLAQKFDANNSTLDLHVADFNLDGHVNFADLLTLAQHFGATSDPLPANLSARFIADWSLAQSLVPEPTSITPMIVTLAGIARLRKGRHG